MPGYRPSQWNNPETLYLKDGLNGYFFDAIIRAQHRREARATEHPVQTGANISDHIFMLPAHLTLDIGMSDAMDSFQDGSKPGKPRQFTDGTSRSVSAYQALRRLLEKRQSFSITTKLDQYDNMIVESIAADDTNETTYGGRFAVYLKEIFTANILTVTVSTRPQVTGQTNKGPVQTLSPTPTGKHIIESSREPEVKHRNNKNRGNDKFLFTPAVFALKGRKLLTWQTNPLKSLLCLAANGV